MSHLTGFLNIYLFIYFRFDRWAKNMFFSIIFSAIFRGIWKLSPITVPSLVMIQYWKLLIFLYYSLWYCLNHYNTENHRLSFLADSDINRALILMFLTQSLSSYFWVLWIIHGNRKCSQSYSTTTFCMMASAGTESGSYWCYPIAHYCY